MMTITDFKKIMLPYNVAVYVYSEPQEVQWARWLNGFVVHNTGTTDVIFAGDRIGPDVSKTIGGNFAEIYRGRLDFVFRMPVPAPPIIVNQVTITQKFYILPDE